MNNNSLKLLVEKFRGKNELEKFSSFKLNNLEDLSTACTECLRVVPPKFGQCAQFSSFLAGFLIDEYKIPAIVVAGNLKIKNTTIFDCKENLPTFLETKKVTVESKIWDGHCWVEIDGYIIDISICRTAYSIKKPSILKNYIESSVGKNKGAIVCPKSQLPVEMEYIPKYILTDNQINGLVASLGYEIKNDI